MCCRRPITRRSARKGFEKKPIGTGPYMVDEYRGQRVPAAEGNDEILGRQAGVRDGGVQVRARRHQPRRRDRKRLVRRDARNSLRGIRSAQGQGRASPASATPISDIGMIFITNVEKVMLDKNVRLAVMPRDRQGRDRQAAAARLRRADRYAGGAGIRGLRSVDQGAVRSRSWRRSCSPRAATRRKSRSSSRSRRRAASSRKITR